MFGDGCAKPLGCLTLRRKSKKLILKPTFSLASVFTLITLLTVWFAVGVRKSQKAESLSDAFLRCGGRVGVVFDPPRNDDKWIGFDRKTRDDISKIGQFFNFLCHNHFPKIRRVSFYYCEASDDLYDCLARAPYLEQVSVLGDNDGVVPEHQAIADRVSQLRPDVIVEVWSELPAY